MRYSDFAIIVLCIVMWIQLHRRVGAVTEKVRKSIRQDQIVLTRFLRDEIRSRSDVAKR